MPASTGRWGLLIALSVAVAGVAALLLWRLPDWPWASQPETPRQDWLSADGAGPEGSVREIPPEVAALQQEATEVARRLLEQFPETAESLDVVAILHLRLGRNEQAMKCWQHCVELAPQFAGAYVAMGSAARDKGEFAGAAELFEKAAELDPQLPGILVDLSDVLIKQGELDRAQAVVEKSLQSDPRFFPSLYHLGQIHLQRKDYAKARKTLEAAIRSGPDFASAYFGLATACSKLGDDQQAKQYTDRFKLLKARDEQAHRDSLKAQDPLSDVRQSVAGVCTAASRVYLLHGDPQTAEGLLLRACQLAPTYAECAEMLARLYEHQGRDEEALKTLTRFSGSSSKSVAVQVHLGTLASKMGRFEQAEQAYQEAIELSPGQARAYAMLADFYLRAGRKLPEAKRLAEKAVELEPEATFYRLLGVACQKAGDPTGARRASQQASAMGARNGPDRGLQQRAEK